MLERPINPTLCGLSRIGISLVKAVNLDSGEPRYLGRTAGEMHIC